MLTCAHCISLRFHARSVPKTCPRISRLSQRKRVNPRDLLDSSQFCAATRPVPIIDALLSKEILCCAIPGNKNLA
jgi:hypothetical protein